MAKKEEEVIWAFACLSSNLVMKRSKKPLLHFLPTDPSSGSSLCWVRGGFHRNQVAILFERKARTATEYLRFVRSFHKLKPFISL